MKLFYSTDVVVYIELQGLSLVFCIFKTELGQAAVVHHNV